jgi:hypothetical protein
MRRASRINSIAYTDSLPYKPKYVKLTLEDKIGLTALLNDNEHKGIARYLSLDDKYRMVTSLDTALTEAEIQNFTMADGVQLQKDSFDAIKLVLTNKR